MKKALAIFFGLETFFYTFFIKLFGFINNFYGLLSVRMRKKKLSNMAAEPGATV